MWSEETLTAAHGISLLRALTDEFGENIVVLSHQTPYFYAKDLWEFVGDDRAPEFVGDTAVERVVGDALQVWYFPSHAPELNLVEGCWDPLESWFNYRLVRDLDQLKTLLNIAFPTINLPLILNYFCP